MSNWREAHKSQMYHLKELVRQARAFAQDDSRLEYLADAALDYAMSVRRMTGVERGR